MATRRLQIVETTGEITDALHTFNLDRPTPSGVARDLVRRTSYWVFDQTSETFAPSKFVGFKRMTFELYERARRGQTVGDKFDGFLTRAAIEAAAGAFSQCLPLHQPLNEWATSLFGDDVFDGVDVGKWQFAKVGQPSHPVLQPEAWLWQPLVEDVLKHVPDAAGAYVVRVIASNGKPQLIRRCVGGDSNGILDVGESEDLRSRLRTLLRCMSDPKQRGHTAGWRYAYLGMNALFPLTRLQFAFKQTNSKVDAYALEGSILEAYVNRHFELPPLNYKFNWSGWKDER
jgi:hypothetical protein